MPSCLVARLCLGCALMAMVGLAQSGPVDRGEGDRRQAVILDLASPYDDEPLAAARAQTPDSMEGLPTRNLSMDAITLGYRDRTEYWAATAGLEVNEPQTLALLSLGLAAIALLSPGVASRRTP